MVVMEVDCGCDDGGRVVVMEVDCGCDEVDCGCNEGGRVVVMRLIVVVMREDGWL